MGPSVKIDAARGPEVRGPRKWHVRKRSPRSNSSPRRCRNSEGLILADFSGLTVAEVNELRSKCREQGVEFRVVKNRLARRAATAAEAQRPRGAAEGSDRDRVRFREPGRAREGARRVREAERAHRDQGRTSSRARSSVSPRSKALSELPSRDELLALIARTFNAPTQGFVNVLQGTVSSFVRALNAVAEQRAEAE